MQDETYKWFRKAFAWALLGVGGCGIPVNLLPFWLLWRKRTLSNFQLLLIILSISDLIVVVGCMMIYGLPDVWPNFAVYTFPVISPWLIPIMQIALLTSVYSTVLLSFERFVRVKYTCNLKKSKYFNEDNFKYYLMALLIIPTLFYLPKFFEYDTVQTTQTIKDVHPCASQTNETGCVWDPTEKSLVQYSYREFNDTELQFSWLRKNYYYRRIYNMGLNSTFATLIPFIALIYFNVQTCKIIRQRTKRHKEEFHTIRVADRAYKIKRSSSFEINMKYRNEGLTFQFSTPKQLLATQLNGTSKVETVHLDYPLLDKVDIINADNIETDAYEIDSLSQIRTSSRSIRRSESFQRSPNRQPPLYARRFFYKNEKTLTRISVYIVWMFLGSHVWKIGPNIYEVFHMDESSKWPRWMDYFCLVSHLMLVANSSLNFLMYLIL